MWLSKRFTDFATYVASVTGRPSVFLLAILLIAAWGVTGPLFGYSDTWQLIVNTATTIVTFLMVFLIQNTQNRDGAAIQVKLDELIRTSSAQNVYIGIEHLTPEEVEDVRKRCERRARTGLSGKAATAAEKAQKSGNRKAPEAVEQSAS
jgi:low affinity Fe/Cu permease